MTHNEFSHILSTVDALSPDQVRQLIRKLENKMATTGKPAAPRCEAIEA